MTTKSLSTDGSPRKDFGFKDKELVLLDEDCLVDESEAFSMFKFLDIVECSRFSVLNEVNDGVGLVHDMETIPEMEVAHVNVGVGELNKLLEQEESLWFQRLILNRY
ncbi:hypothetical protein V6N11_000376 [Hibiscus sabdariffa]|uniref:Uncharacterized protein n=1 Tax=Hibiscus sabdariffa TaxID=183260 RepID=A0ABR2A8T9_9ROSI